MYAICKTGGRATSALSILSKHGFENIINVDNGMTGLMEKGIEVKYAACPRTGVWKENTTEIK